MAMFFRKRRKMIIFNNYKHNFGSENITIGLIRWLNVKCNCSTKIYNDWWNSNEFTRIHSHGH